MDRRGFLKGILGLAASAALPARAVEFLSSQDGVSDAEFISAADTALIDLLGARIEAISKQLMEVVQGDIYAAAIPGAYEGIDRAESWFWREHKSSLTSVTIPTPQKEK